MSILRADRGPFMLRERSEPQSEAIRALVICSSGHQGIMTLCSGPEPADPLLLRQRGADPNSVGRFKRVPLWRATFGSHVEAAVVLLAAGADPRLVRHCLWRVSPLCVDG